MTQNPLLLESGIRLLSETIPASPSFSAALWFPLGSRNQAPRAEGFFHFLEHMLFKGTRFRAAQKLWEDLERTGGSANGFTDRDSLCLQVSLPAADWEIGLSFLLECAFSSTLPVEEFERERAVILSELLQIEDDIEEGAYDSFLALYWDGHPASLPIAGRAEALRSIPRSELLAFAGELAIPSRAWLTVTGSFEPRLLELRLNEELKRLEPPGGWPEPPCESSYILYPPPPQPLAISRLRSEPKSAQAYYFEAIQIPLPRTMEAFASLWAASALLGEGSGSRLFKRLREELGLVYSIQANLITGQDEAFLLVQASCPRESLALCVRTIGEEMDSLFAHGPSEQEFADLRSRLSGGFDLGREDPDARLRRMGHWALSLGILPNPDEEGRMYRNMVKASLDAALEGLSRGLRGRFAYGRLGIAALRRLGFEG